MEIADDTTFAIRDDVISEEIEDELVVLDLEGDVYFSLNDVGRLIWEAISDGKTFSEVVDAICETYDVERDRASEDAVAFLEDTLDRELLSVRDD